MPSKSSPPVPQQTIDQVWPSIESAISDEQILQLYEPPQHPWWRMNFISSVDGALTRDGLSGGLGDAADHRVFDLLRYWADVVVVAAGTVRAEGYGAMRLSAEAASWRAAAGLAPQPVFAIVTASAGLDAESEIFSQAPVRPVIYTVDSAPPDRVSELSAVADVVAVGHDEVDPVRMRADLVSRGLSRIHCEGGPGLFGSLLTAGMVDELCLTIAPTVDAGTSGRIAHSPSAVPTAMRLSQILRAGDELFLSYHRADR